MTPEPKRHLKVFLYHAHADRDPVPQGDDIPQGDDMRGIYSRLTQDGVDAWLDKAKLHGERSRTILPGQDWDWEIRKAARESIICSQEKAGNL